MRRVAKWSGLVLVVIAIGAAAVVALDRSEIIEVLPDGGIFGDADEGDQTATSGAPHSVLYLRGSTLHVYDASAREDEELIDLPSADVAASPTTSWVAYVALESASDSSSPAAEQVPVVHLLEPATERDLTVGPGTMPRWDHSGTRLAYLRPVDPSSDCVGEQCPGDREVVVFDPETEQEESLLGPGRWDLHAWAGDRVLVSRGRSPERTVAVSTDGERTTIDIAPDSIWDGSPDGRWLLTVGNRTQFVPLEDGEIAGDPVRIPLGRRTLSESAWSHDSSEVAAVLVSSLPEPVVFAPDRPRPEPVTEAFFATGPVLWTEEDDALVVPRVINARKGKFEAALCPLEGEQSQCESLFSFGKKVVLLRAQ